MRKLSLAATGAASALALLALAGCGGGNKGGVFAGRSGPDEFAVARRAPLVVPPDFALVPPKPGAPRPQEADSGTQALSAMFGGAARVSGSEAGVITAAGRTAAPGIRSETGGSDTTVVDKGAVTRDIIAAPTGNSTEASVSTTPGIATPDRAGNQAPAALDRPADPTPH